MRVAARAEQTAEKLRPQGLVTGRDFRASPERSRMGADKAEKINRALHAEKKLHFRGFVTGHDFSRADKANEINRALAPADARWAKLLEISPFSAACLGPGSGQECPFFSGSDAITSLPRWPGR